MIRQINLTFAKGKVTSVIGPNGCGKSTLLKTASRLLRPLEGHVLVQGKDSSEWRPKEFARLVAVVPQSRAVPAITAETMVLHGRFPYLGFPRKPSPADLDMVSQAMRLVGVYPYRKKMLTALSGGERQKVYLAMALAQDTPVILLDEPTTYLDIKHQLEILRLIDQLRAMGKTVVMVMHDLAQALTTSDQICLMQAGEIVLCDTAEAVLASREIDRVFGVRSHSLGAPDGQNYYLFTEQARALCPDRL